MSEAVCAALRPALKQISTTHEPAIVVPLSFWSELWLGLCIGGVYLDHYQLPAAGLAGHHGGRWHGGRTGQCLDGVVAHHGGAGGYCLRGVLFHHLAPARGLAAACADGDVGLVGAGHGGVVEAVKSATFQIAIHKQGSRWLLFVFMVFDSCLRLLRKG